MMKQDELNRILTSKSNLVRILDNLREGIIAHDLDRKIFFFNREAERITGYKRDEVLNLDCHAAFGEPFCGQHCLFREPAASLPETAEYPVTILTKDGQTRHAEMSVTLMNDENAAPFGVLAFIKDLTDVLRCRFRSGGVDGYAGIVGRDRKMRQIFQQIQELAAYDYPVHIYGETGTGKELVAEAVHHASRREGGPFVPINCGALPEGLIESELFGHVRGAFSGAIRDKKGRFELARGGTAFLDEVAELSREMQVKLLRFLQTGRFERVGGEETISVDVRIVSATNTDLKEAVARKAFREDLYYRLNVIPIDLPPLRERKNDIPLLVEHFLGQIDGRGQGGAVSISREALLLMMDYQWPGNVRQLQNVLHYATVKCGGKVIRPEHLPAELGVLVPHSASPRSGRKLDYASVRAALEKTGSNKSKAARLLGVGRATLYRFLNDQPGAAPSDS
jgi:sigma-54 dependent transcriptional regulator, acetoin dehydrogenase operon transcriptional activator AcoR